MPVKFDEVQCIVF